MTFALSGISGTTDIFAAKMGWDEDETILNNTITSSASIIGIMVGTFSGGQLIKIGRRKAFFVSNLVSVLGCCFVMNLHLSTLIIGRFLTGVAGGLSCCITPKCYGENIPGHLST